MAQRAKSLPQCGRPEFNPWGGEDPLEKEMATHSSILAWKIPWMEQPGGLQFLFQTEINFGVHLVEKVSGNPP